MEASLRLTFLLAGYFLVFVGALFMWDWPGALFALGILCLVDKFL